VGAVAGAWVTDGRGVARAELEAMAATLAHRGPVGQSLWCHGPVGLAHRQDRIVPRISDAGQPLGDASGRWRIAMSGRVFNWPELARELAARDGGAAATDCLQTVLRLYIADGTAAFARCNGAFACAIWDSAEQSLLLVRDALGIKPMYYAHSGGLAVFGSEIKAVLAHPRISAAPDDQGIADFLSVNRFLLLSGSTCYAGVRKLLPGHYCRISAAGLQGAAYWQIDPRRELHYGSDEERVAAVRELMVDAVRIRLPREDRFAAALSGGFDSSSVVCLLRHLLREDGRPGARLDTVSYNFGSIEADEPELVELVARQAGAVHHTLHVLQPDFFDDLDAVIRANDGPVVESTALLLYKKKRLIGQLGLPISFSGIGGDELFQGQLDYFADLLAQGRLGELWREIKGVYPLNPITGKATALGPLLRAFVLSPLWPAWMRQLRGTHNGIPYPPDWLSPALLRRAGIGRRLPDPARPRFGSHYDQSCWDLFFYELVGASAHYHDCAGAPFAIDTRLPLMDMRLVETMFATPRHWKYREGRVRAMQKQAMQPFLPREILEDHIKKDHHPTVVGFMQTALRQQVQQLLEGRQQLSRAYVDWPRLLRHTEPFFAGKPYNPLPIWLTMALERWLQLSFGRG
jgi:asparagine synthase (glutamine-hydrolysing)